MPCLPVTDGYRCPSLHDAFRTVPDKGTPFRESFVNTILMSPGVKDSLSTRHSLLHDSSEADGTQTESWAESEDDESKLSHLCPKRLRTVPHRATPPALPGLLALILPVWTLARDLTLPPGLSLAWAPCTGCQPLCFLCTMSFHLHNNPGEVDNPGSILQVRKLRPRQAI